MTQHEDDSLQVEFDSVMEQVCRREPCPDVDALGDRIFALLEMFCDRGDPRYSELGEALLKYEWIRVGKEAITFPATTQTSRFRVTVEFLRSQRDGVTDVPVADNLDWFYKLTDLAGLSAADIERALEAGPRSFEWAMLVDTVDTEYLVARCGLQLGRCPVCDGRPSHCACILAKRLEAWRQERPH